MVVIPDVYASAADTASFAPFSSINILATVLKQGSTDSDTLLRHLISEKKYKNYLCIIIFKPDMHQPQTST